MQLRHNTLRILKTDGGFLDEGIVQAAAKATDELSPRLHHEGSRAPAGNPDLP